MSYEFVEDETSNYAFRFPACVTQSPSRLCYLCNWVTPASSGSSSNATTSYMFSLYYHIGLVKIYYWFELTRAMVDFMWLMCYVYIPPNWLRLALTFSFVKSHRFNSMDTLNIAINIMINTCEDFLLNMLVMGLLPDTETCRCACAGNAGNVFPAIGGKRSRHASRHVRDARAVMHAGIAN